MAIPKRRRNRRRNYNSDKAIQPRWLREHPTPFKPVYKPTNEASLQATGNCETVEDVVFALGGRSKVRTLTKRGPSHVTNWLSGKRFPANTFVVLTNALKKKGYRAPPSLWGMTE